MLRSSIIQTGSLYLSYLLHPCFQSLVSQRTCVFKEFALLYRNLAFYFHSPHHVPSRNYFQPQSVVNDLLPALIPQQLSSLRETFVFLFLFPLCTSVLVYLDPGTYTEGFPAQEQPWLHFPDDPRITLLNTA